MIMSADPKEVQDQLYDNRFQNDVAYNIIQKKCVKMKRSDIKACNQILKSVILDEIIDKMKWQDRDFATLYEKLMFGGSFYKNLKVGKPNEFDLCLLINLSKSINSEFLKIQPDYANPSYVKIKVLRRNFNKNASLWSKILDKDNYLNQNKFRSWIQGILDRTFTEFRRVHNEYIVEFKRHEVYLQKYQSGAAFTIHLTKYNQDGTTTMIDFDLVPCLVFQNQFIRGFRPRRAKEWIAIAKPKKPRTTWRAGFFNDEKRILAGHIKPIIRMVKKLRDIYEWKPLKSYFIETLFYHELDEKQNPYFAHYYYKHARTAVFMYMIRKLYEKLVSQKLFDYWHTGFNLLRKNINRPQILEIANKLGGIIEEIETNIDNYYAYGDEKDDYSDEFGEDDSSDEYEEDYDDDEYDEIDDYEDDEEDDDDEEDEYEDEYDEDDYSVEYDEEDYDDEEDDDDAEYYDDEDDDDEYYDDSHILLQIFQCTDEEV